ncbi:MAG: RHS repeat-associated core domain-containing protein [Bacteroidota bacterium]
MDTSGCLKVSVGYNPYLYNGKEQMEGTGLYAYGFRYYDPTIGRFTGVDPIADQFAHVSGFNYAENMPTIAIDLHGLQAVILHGTTQVEHSFSNAALDELQRIGNNSMRIEDITWHAPLLNTKNSRRNSARKVAAQIIKRRNGLIESGEISADEPITLVGYSHGGNVAIQTAQLLEDELGTEVNLITVSTPAYNGDRGRDGWMLTEDPAKANGIGNHLQIVHENDKVASKYAMGNNEATYTGGATNNRVITNEEIPISDGIQAHYLPNNSELPKILKELPSFPKKE